MLLYIQNFKFGSGDPHHPHFMGQFVRHWLVPVILNVRTKYEVSIFNFRNLYCGSENFKMCHVTQAMSRGGEFFISRQRTSCNE